MAADGDELIADQEKVRIVSNFILHSPPGEFNEVFNDVRVLLNNDDLLKEGASGAFSQYNKDQLMAVKLENSVHPVLITAHNDLGGCRFFDSRSKQSFKFDHLRKEAIDYESWEPEPGTEAWRLPLEEVFDAYTLHHYKNGVSCVFARRQGSAVILSACIEQHQFQPKNFWNGRWRSQWTVTVNNGSAEVRGLLKVQVHYYEDGNVQLVTSKDIKEILVASSEEQLAIDLVKLVEEAEGIYQKAISENYQTMSDTTFKALRRLLPVTRTKIDWSKIGSYSIGKELKNLEDKNEVPRTNSKEDCDLVPQTNSKEDRDVVQQTNSKEDRDVTAQNPTIINSEDADEVEIISIIPGPSGNLGIPRPMKWLPQNSIPSGSRQNRKRKLNKKTKVKAKRCCGPLLDFLKSEKRILVSVGTSTDDLLNHDRINGQSNSVSVATCTDDLD